MKIKLAEVESGHAYRLDYCQVRSEPFGT